LLDKELKCLEAPAAGRHFEHSSLGTFAIEDRPNVEALKQAAAAGDVCG
jgi:hypothetical protein